MTAQTATFNPLRVGRGEFRISLNLTALGESAWDVLEQAKSIGFPKPTFHSFQSREGLQTWAVLASEQGDYTHDRLEQFLLKWEPMLQQLPLGDWNETVLIAGRFAQDTIAA